MREPDLFGDTGELDERGGPGRADGHDQGGRDEAESAHAATAPLAARMRPRSLAEFHGQRHLLAEGRTLRSMIATGRPSSMILWGPPGSGKTTLARILAAETGHRFVPLSAVTDGVARLREIVREARTRLEATGLRTIVFCDEIHRFNKAQQDAFLPHVEAGTVILVGATTENPSFEVVRPLLSRAPVLVLEPLSVEELRAVLVDALRDETRGLGGWGLEVTDEALDFLAVSADGDARRALGVLEAAAGLARSTGSIGLPVAREALQHRYATYDKSGEEHYNLISAFHKSVRGSDPDAALYWLARMIDGGEDPLYVARRMVRMAIEDIGMAEPAALEVAVAARDAYQFLGSPEGDLALAQACVFLATAPKSIRVYEAWSAALELARRTPGAPVPMHLRNAPTELMREHGYGKGYRYDPAEADGVARQRYLPDPVEPEGGALYRPGPFGFEKTVQERLDWWARRRSAPGDGS